jgi:sulfoxide reductase heme-binding subunit YedZ
MNSPRKSRLDRLLRAAVHVGSLLPLGILIYQAFIGGLTANPIQAAEQRTGDMAILLLLLSLACTPLSTLTGFARLTQRSRTLGLYAFLYAVLHLFLFTVVDYGLDWGLLWGQLSEKPYILAGTLAFLVLLVLAVTSFRWWMKRMGRRWKSLHRLVYLAGVIAVFHFGWALKGDFLRLSGDVQRPALAGAVLLLLLVLRLPPVRRALTRLRQ